MFWIRWQFYFLTVPILYPIVTGMGFIGLVGNHDGRFIEMSMILRPSPEPY
jgi:hypothetical protein